MNLKKLNPEDLLTQAQAFADEISALKLAATEQATECSNHSATIEQQANTIKEQAEQINLLNGIIGSAKGPAQTSIEVTAKNVAPMIPAEPIEFNGKKYLWQRSGFRLAGTIQKYSAQEASSDTDVLTRLLAIPGQSILKELE